MKFRSGKMTDVYGLNGTSNFRVKFCTITFKLYVNIRKFSWNVLFSCHCDIIMTSFKSQQIKLRTLQERDAAELEDSAHAMEIMQNLCREYAR